MRAISVALVASSLAAGAQAQTVIQTTGPAVHARFDLDTGISSVIPGPDAAGPNTVLCLDNTIDDDGIFDALLYPAGEELYDWGVKSCGVSRFVDRITIGFGSTAVPVGQGGPGGSLTIRIYELGQGFGNPGSLVLELPLTGLPSYPSVAVSPVFLDIELGDRSFRAPDGPIGWSYENQDGLTAPILVDVDPLIGNELFYDVYSPAPAQPASYQGTHTLGPGGASNDPKENSFYLRLYEDSTPGEIDMILASPNPNILWTTEPPIMGFTWKTRFRLDRVESRGITLVAIANSRVTGVPFRYGTLVTNLSDLACPISVSATDYHSFRVPTHSSLSGRQLVVQGAYINGNGWPKLTNAMRATIGARIAPPQGDGGGDAATGYGTSRGRTPAHGLR